MKRLAPLALFGVSVWLLTARADTPASTPVLVVHLKPCITVVDPLITIGDVAALADGSPKLHEAVSSLDLVELGTTGAAIISHEQVSIRIQIAGFDRRAFRITGAAQAEVVLDRSQVTEESVVAAARQAVRRKLPGKAHRASLKLLRPVSLPQLVIKRGDHIYLSADWSGAPGDHGPVEIEVAVTINGKRQATVPVLLDLGMPAAPTHQKVDFRPKQDDVSKAKAIQPAAFKDNPIHGQKVGKDELPGLVVSRTDRIPAAAENPIVIRARESVRLLARVGSLRVTVSGEALQEGRVGQTIRVRNIDSNKVILGRVVESGIVEIDF